MMPGERALTPALSRSREREKTLLARARGMRREPTEAERKLWAILRSRQIAGFKFRRQVPVGPFIVDFLCKQHRLVLECDGGAHADSSYDARRDESLRAQGSRILRLWNNDILSNPDGVAEAIIAMLTPSPARGRGLG